VPTASRSFLFVGGVLALSSVPLAMIGGRFQRRYADAQRLRRTGVAGTAQVLGARQTGMSLNDQPQVVRDLRITAPGHGTYAGSLDEQSRPVYSVQLHIQIEGRAPMAGPAVFAVPLERVAVMHPGGVIPIKADPYDPMKFAADWDHLPTSP